ncbi:hypothetical protein PENANT_c021G08032 [Penicillium antarcticum]|uniref:Protein kinase domain-containing protein n=1 Tax=Penicillium antarcticum TaxID=416450 RepID=A0A1V6PZV5_9EURO|nr:uncharacterized protein N7508_010917 [Penicillium antarcticum]KAJ5296096.1 hypothetical protein N7508_010917 [Penicillium antarcticum]OQD82509.1 hypothetical protein PENANT_c021G08032 [Penicillium antarcticum]
MHHEVTKCPYVVGNTIELHLNTPHDGQTTKAKIIKVFEPFTLSCVMVVRLEYPDFDMEGDLVLKLFDRRFATQLREDEKIHPWTLDIEERYHQFILDDGAEKNIQMLNTNSESRSEESGTRNDAQNEAYAHDRSADFYKSEIRAYRTLKDIQGTEVPKHYACVTLPTSHEASMRQYADIPGILLQHIEGFRLVDLAAHAPRESWQYICEDAIRIVNICTDRGILNLDVRTRSFIIERIREDKFKPVMIDFALCRFREDFDSEEDWRLRKSGADEEGAIGRYMQTILQGGFDYHHDAYNLKLDEEFKMEG